MTVKVMVLENMKCAYFDLYLSQMMWNHAKYSMKRLRRPTKVFLQWGVDQVKDSIPWVRCASGNVWYFREQSQRLVTFQTFDRMKMRMFRQHKQPGKPSPGENMKRSLIENHPNPNKGRARCYDVLLMSSHNWKKPQNIKIWNWTTFEIVFCVKLQSCQ